MFHSKLKALHCAAPVVALVLIGTAAQAQFLKRAHKDNASISVGGTGQFSTILTSSPNAVSYPNGAITSTAINQRQDTTWSAGFVTSLQLHPVSWAGIALNYGFSHYQERFSYDDAATGAHHNSAIPTDWHEATAGYLMHPKHIPFQPYVVIGGGAIGFVPSGGTTQFNSTNAPDQWRGAGLLETGFDLPTHSSHIGFRISGRSLYYRSPNFNSAVVSTRSWRVTTEPAVSAYYRF